LLSHPVKSKLVIGVVVSYLYHRALFLQTSASSKCDTVRSKSLEGLSFFRCCLISVDAKTCAQAMERLVRSALWELYTTEKF